MSQSDGIPDWTPILGGVAALLTAIGGVWAIITGAFRQKKGDVATQGEATLTNIWKLVNELQEERERCYIRIEALETKVIKLEGRADALTELLRGHT